MPCKYNDRSVFDPEKAKALKEVRALRKSLVNETKALEMPGQRDPYDIALNIQNIKEDIRIILAEELRPYVAFRREEDESNDGSMDTHSSVG